jgi:hypothetical protein
MEDHTVLDVWAEDPCPVHDTPIRKIYNFGKYNDAEVATFAGCRCAVCTNQASLVAGRLGHEVTYHRSWGGAEGRARLIVMQERACVLR